MNFLRKSYLILLPLIILSCSTKEDEPVAPIALELESKIIGKWNTTSTNEIVATIQKDEERCKITYFIFRADGTFAMEYQSGVVEGNYTLINETTIELNNLGTLSQIRFNFQALTFQVELPGICSQTGQYNNDPDFVFGSCYSFLNCYNNSVWKNTSENKTTFIQFKESTTWIEKYVFDSSEDCLVPSSNTTDIGVFTIFEHYVKQIKFIHQKQSELTVTTYKELESGNIEETIETELISFTKIYEPAEEADFNGLLDYPDCRPKTYIPDDFFETILIELGYDDVMDNYVLTQNIENIENITLGYNDGREIYDITGIDDFEALKHLTLNANFLKTLDLRENQKLESFFIGSNNLEVLNISNNNNLKSFYLEYVHLDTLILPESPNLKGFEITQVYIESLDISKQTGLEYVILESENLKSFKSALNYNLIDLQISGNDLEFIEFINFPNLERLSLGNTLIEEIDFSVLDKLKNLEFYKNDNLITIDLSPLNLLMSFSLTNTSLTKLNISQNNNLSNFYGYQNEGLFCIEVSTSQLEKTENQPNSWGIDDWAEFSLECGN